MSWIAVGCFLAIIAITLVITYLAARRTHSAADFYVAGGRISGTQNGLAIAGDFMSAATLLGITAMIFVAGYDAAAYLGAGMVAFSIFIFFMTDKLRALGTYTFTDILCTRLEPRPIRVLAATTSLVSALMYLMVQVVGAGALIQVLFEIDYAVAVVIVSILMVFYVAVGGMLATTWVQIIKAVLLLAGVGVLAVLTLAEFGFDMSQLHSAAQAKHGAQQLLFVPGGLQLDLISSLSLGLGLTFGLLGSPHLLMRFFTVPDAYQARKSAVVAVTCVAIVGILIFFVVGLGAVALVKGNPAFYQADGLVVGGDNMVAIHLARYVGGEVFFGIMAAVAFATILAVVAGLTLASAAAVSHDLYAGVYRDGKASEREEILVSRITTVVVGVLVIVLGLAFEGQNVAYLVSLALAVAASTNFPLLILAMYWKRFTTRGAILGGITGLVTTIALVVLGPAVWVTVLGFAEPVFPSPYPAIYSMAAAFGVMFLVSMLQPAADEISSERVTSDAP
ncbi:MAG: cation acetate symporter [Gammaproteobacteria bacterium]|nr:cation acetate symporter [Gammaproteobacteria bacterium]